MSLSIKHLRAKVKDDILPSFFPPKYVSSGLLLKLNDQAVPYSIWRQVRDVPYFDILNRCLREKGATPISEHRA